MVRDRVFYRRKQGLRSCRLDRIVVGRRLEGNRPTLHLMCFLREEAGVGSHTPTFTACVLLGRASQR